MPITEPQFNEKQKELYNLMSDISEDCFFAGWFFGFEYYLWDNLQKGDDYHKDINKEQLDRCGELSRELNGWIIWMDNLDDPNMPVKDWGPRFLDMDDWLEVNAKSSPTSQHPPLTE